MTQKADLCLAVFVSLKIPRESRKVYFRHGHFHKETFNRLKFPSKLNAIVSLMFEKSHDTVSDNYIVPLVPHQPTFRKKSENLANYNFSNEYEWHAIGLRNFAYPRRYAEKTSWLFLNNPRKRFYRLAHSVAKTSRNHFTLSWVLVQSVVYLLRSFKLLFNLLNSSEDFMLPTTPSLHTTIMRG